MSVVAVSLKDVRFYMRNVRTRMPFKYGVAVLIRYQFCTW